MTRLSSSESAPAAVQSDPILTPAQVGRVLQVSERRVLTLMRTGQMPSVLTGVRQRRCSASQLQRFIDLGGTHGYVRAELAALDKARGVGRRRRR